MAICPKCGERERHRHYAYCKECRNDHKREHYAANREKVHDYYKNPDNLKKAIARQAARKAFPKPQPCEECGSEEFVERHHEDYDKPLEIRWLCKGCHAKHHLQA